MDHRAHERGIGMLNTPYVKKDTIKNFFPVPNAVFDLGLHHMEINIYAYLLRIEDRRTYQHLAGKVLLGPVAAAMLRAEQVQSLKRCTVESNKAIQHGGMAPDNEITIVVEVCWNVDVFCPAFVGGAEASIPLEFVQCVGEYPCCALVCTSGYP